MFSVRRLEEEDGAEEQKEVQIEKTHKHKKEKKSKKEKKKRKEVKPPSSSSSSDSDSNDDGARSASASALASAPPTTPNPKATPAPFVPVSTTMFSQFGFVLPSGAPPTAADAESEAKRRAEVAAKLQAEAQTHTQTQAKAQAQAPSQASSQSQSTASASTKSTTPAASPSSSIQTLTAKQAKKLVSVQKLNANQAAKLDAKALEEYRAARMADKKAKKAMRRESPEEWKREKERMKQEREEKEREKKNTKQNKQAQSIKAEPHSLDGVSNGALASNAPSKSTPTPLPVTPSVPAPSAGTNAALRGLRKKDESVRAAERAERKRARMEAEARERGISVEELEAEKAKAVAAAAPSSIPSAVEPASPPVISAEADAALTSHRRMLDDMRSARMAAVEQRDADDAHKRVRRSAPTHSHSTAPTPTPQPIPTPIPTPSPSSSPSPSSAQLASHAMHAKPLWVTRGKKVSKLSSASIDDFKLHPLIKEQLRKMKIERFFATQTELIPIILQSYGINDICCCAPTGSGKTLAYAIPIIQSLSGRIVPRLRCVVLLPSRDLALQVYDVFQPFCSALGLKVEVILGQHAFAIEQQRLVERDEHGRPRSKVDILISTPGRLIDHLQADTIAAVEEEQDEERSDGGDRRMMDDGDEGLCYRPTPSSRYGFHLHDLQYLVIDEVDRLLSQNYQDWPSKILSSIYTPQHLQQHSAGRMRVDDAYDELRLVEQSWRRKLGSSGSGGAIGASGNGVVDSSAQLPLQKLLFSATLTNNPQKLASLSLHNPLFFTEGGGGGVVGVGADGESTVIASGTMSSSNKKYSLPPSLKQWVIHLPDDAQKPLVLIQLLKQIKQQAEKEANAKKQDAMDETDANGHAMTRPNANQILIFTSSVESTHRLYRLIESYTDHSSFQVAEFSSALQQQQRNKIIRKFKKGQLNIIICSDAMARGMDIDGVGSVINYDVPPYVQTYVHRVGRTARAGGSGTAYTLVKSMQFPSLRTMLLQADNSFYSNYPHITNQLLEQGMEAYQHALNALKHIMQLEKTGEHPTEKPLTDGVRSQLATFLSSSSSSPSPSSTVAAPNLTPDLEDIQPTDADADADAGAGAGADDKERKKTKKKEKKRKEMEADVTNGTRHTNANANSHAFKSDTQEGQKPKSKKVRL